MRKTNALSSGDDSGGGNGNGWKNWKKNEVGMSSRSNRLSDCRWRIERDFFLSLSERKRTFLHNCSPATDQIPLSISAGKSRDNNKHFTMRMNFEIFLCMTIASWFHCLRKLGIYICHVAACGSLSTSLPLSRHCYRWWNLDLVFQAVNSQQLCTFFQFCFVCCCRWMVLCYILLKETRHV